MDGFYEWAPGLKDGPVGKNGKPPKRPQYIYRCDGEMIAVAGLWSAWRPKGAPADTPWLHTATAITTAANQTMLPVHDRMPVLLPESTWSQWLDPTNHDIEELASLLIPAPEGILTMHELSTDVNNVHNRGAHLTDPSTADTTGKLQSTVVSP